MSRLFSRMTRRYTPAMNRDIMDGLAVKTLDHIEEYLDSEIRSVCAGMPPCLRYIGLERCTPQEEFLENTKARYTRRTFDLAESTIYLIKVFFEFVDDVGQIHKIVRYLYLPYCEEAGTFMLSGTMYHFVPVLSDKVFTPTNGSIFVRLMQDRNIMSRRPYPLIVNGKREAQYVVRAKIYRNKEDSSVSLANKVDTVLTHYLLGRYGFSEMFKRWAGVVPEVGSVEMTTETHPSDQWMLYQSSVPPTKNSKPIRLAVRKTDWTPELETFVYGFYYVLDHFQGRFQPTLKSLDERENWMILIGHIVKGSIYGDNKLFEDIQEHFEFLDGCLDTISQEKLRDKGVELENYYDLLAYVQTHFNSMTRDGDSRGLGVYGKNLEILYYVLYDFIYSFVMVKFRLNKVAKSRVVTLADVTNNLTHFVKPSRPVFKLNSGKIVTEAVSYSGDHRYPKITAVVAEQESQAGAQRSSSKRTVVGPQHHIDLSMIIFGSVLNLPKSNPTPVSRINPWAVIDPRTGTVLENPKYAALLKENAPLFNLT